MRLKAIEFIRKHGSFEFLKTSIPGLFSKEWAANNEREITNLLEKGKNISPAAIIQYYEAMIARPDKTHVLKTFPKPILFLIGQHDPAIPFEQSMQQCYFPDESHVRILRNTGHMGMWEETAKSNDILLSFLCQQPK